MPWGARPSVLTDFGSVVPIHPRAVRTGARLPTEKAARRRVSACRSVSLGASRDDAPSSTVITQNPAGLPFSAGTATPSQPPHLSFPVPRVPFLLGALRAPVSKTLHGQGCGKSPGLCQQPGSEFSVCR